MARRQKKDRMRDKVSLIRTLLGRKEIREAKAVCATIKGSYQQALLRMEIAVTATEAMLRDRDDPYIFPKAAREELQAVCDRINNVQSGDCRDALRDTLVQWLIAVKNFSDARKEADMIVSRHLRLKLLHAIATATRMPEDRSRAMALADTMNDSFSLAQREQEHLARREREKGFLQKHPDILFNDDAVADKVEQCIDAHDWRQALSYAERIGQKAMREELRIVIILGAYAENDLEFVTTAMQYLEDPELAERIYKSMAFAQVAKKDFLKARERAMHIRNPEFRKGVFEQIGAAEAGSKEED